MIRASKPNFRKWRLLHRLKVAARTHNAVDYKKAGQELLKLGERDDPRQ